MLYFLLEARDQDLFNAVTDNGAGGLSSSIGEMGENIGVRLDLDKAPLKYPGLMPWEILISEAQERMSIAVPKDKIDAFLGPFPVANAFGARLSIIKIFGIGI